MTVAPLRLVPDVHRAAHGVALLLERAPELGVTQGEAHILAHLATAGDCTVGELHRALAHRRSTLTSILDRLERRGLLTREVSETDRRSFVVRLTRQGRTLAGRVHALLEGLESRALAGLPDGALSGFRAVVAALQRAAAEADDTP